MFAIRCTAGKTGARCLSSRQRVTTVRLIGALGWPAPPPTPISLLAEAAALPAAVASLRRDSRVPYASAAVSPGGVRAAATATPGSPGAQQPRFGILRISGDGACMFRAIVQGAQIATHGKPLAPESEAGAAHNLRLKVVQELRNRREEMEPFLPGIAADFDEYCRTMSHPMAWGGEPEMVMAVHVVGRPITVYHVQGAGGLEPIVTYGEQLLAACPQLEPIHLLWSGAHYDLLVPLGGSVPE